MLTDKELEVMRNIIAAVETGGQVYGKGRYDDFTPAYANAPSETAITIGRYQHYGQEALQLLKRIKAADPVLFKKLDTAGVAKDMWGSWGHYKATRNSAKAKAIQAIISSTVGKKCQDEMVNEQMQKFVSEAEQLGVTDHQAQAMCANFRHQGGPGAVKRILKKTKKPYTLDNLYAACKTDTGNQVGAYKTRQKCVYTWLKQYWPDNNNHTEPVVAKKEDTPVIPKATVKSGYNKTTKWIGKVNVNDPKGRLNFRTSPSTKATTLKSYPTLGHNWEVNVCDEITVNGKKWYYISYKGKYGFVPAKYIVEVKK